MLIYSGERQLRSLFADTSLDESLYPVLEQRLGEIAGMFGELISYGKTYPNGIRGDIDEFLAANRYPRKSRSALVNELFDWFYIATDKSSFRSAMKLYFDSPRKYYGYSLSAAEVEKRLPETWKVYQKFLDNIDVDEFEWAVDEIHNSGSEIVQNRTLLKHCRNIITTIPEDKIK